MKKIKILLSVFILAAFFVVDSFAQKYNKENVKNEEEFKAKLTSLTKQKADLTMEAEQLEQDIEKVKKDKEALQKYEECIDELYAMVGATRADVENFRNAVNNLNGKIQRQESPKADRQKELNELKKNKISALSEFFDRVHNQMQRALDAWEGATKEITYTVVRGDHLWKISGMRQHFGNPFAWPKLYQANKDKIKNPDLIYPKQVFTIPQLTDAEKERYDRLRRNYKATPK